MTETTTEAVAPAETVEDAGTAPAPAANRPITRRFRSASSVNRLAPDVQKRHGQVATQAFLGFRDATRAREFLNTHDETLGGRPLDIAGESAEGLAAVEAAIRAQSGGTTAA